MVAGAEGYRRLSGSRLKSSVCGKEHSFHGINIVYDYVHESRNHYSSETKHTLHCP